MKQKLSVLSLALFFVLFLTTFSNIVLAQESAASNSAVIPTLSVFPTFFPSVTPSPTPIVKLHFLQQFDELTSPIATPSAASSSAAPQLSPDYAQDYCLNVPIIMYHHIEPLSIATQLGHAALTTDPYYFEEHIRYLKEHHYHFLSLEDLVHTILSRGTVPDKSVVITIDDGYIDDYTYAFLIAKKYHVIINFNIPTGLVGQPDYMTWDHLKEMAASPYARIYNHTTTHAPLGLINQDQIIKEVTTANDALKTNLGINNDIVVYPYGNYNDLAIQTLKQLGMIAAVSTDPGTDDCISNIYKLPRVRAGNEPIEDYGY